MADKKPTPEEVEAMKAYYQTANQIGALIEIGMDAIAMVPGSAPTGMPHFRAMVGAAVIAGALETIKDADEEAAKRTFQELASGLMQLGQRLELTSSVKETEDA